MGFGKSPGAGHRLCNDEAGLETALRLRDEAKKAGDDLSLTAVTLGSGSYDYFFRSLFALGFERIVQIRLPEPVCFTPERVSRAIAHVFSGEVYDAVICGVQSADTSGGTTPYLIAKKMALPCIPNVIEMKYKSGLLAIRRETAGGESSATINTPAVYAVGNSVNPYLRMATVKNRLAAAQLQPEFIDASDLSLPDVEPLELIGFVGRKSGKTCTFVEGDSCAEKAASLIKLCPEVKSS